MNCNLVILIGRVTRDPELKTLAGGTTTVNISIATNETWKDKNTGEKKEETQFHDCTAWGKQAEVIAQYVVKGQELFIQGSLKHRQWDKPDGTKGYATSITIKEFQFGAKAKGAGETGSTPSPMDYGSPLGSDGKLKSTNNDGNDIRVEDIPF